MHIGHRQRASFSTVAGVVLMSSRDAEGGKRSEVASCLLFILCNRGSGPLHSLWLPRDTGPTVSVALGRYLVLFFPRAALADIFGPCRPLGE